MTMGELLHQQSGLATSSPPAMDENQHQLNQSLNQSLNQALNLKQQQQQQDIKATTPSPSPMLNQNPHNPNNAANISKNLANMEKIDNDRLILAVKESPFLYDTSHRDYKDTGIKSAAWEAIATQFDVTPVECQTRWKNLRDRYTRERQRMSKGLIDYSKWRLFPILDFLYPFLHQRTRSEYSNTALNLSASNNGLSMVTCNSNTPPIGQHSSSHSDSHSGSPSVDNDIDSNSDRDSVHDSKAHSFSGGGGIKREADGTPTTPLNYATHTPNPTGVMTPVAKRARPASLMPDASLLSSSSLLHSLSSSLQLPDLSQMLATMNAANIPVHSMLASLNSLNSLNSTTDTLASLTPLLNGSLSAQIPSTSTAGLSHLTPLLASMQTSTAMSMPPSTTHLAHSTSYNSNILNGANMPSTNQHRSSQPPPSSILGIASSTCNASNKLSTISSTGAAPSSTTAATTSASSTTPAPVTTTTTTSVNNNNSDDVSSSALNPLALPTSFNGIENSLAQLLQDEDEDIHFALSVGYQLRKLNGQARALAKLKIQQVMYDVEYGVPSSGLPPIVPPPMAHNTDRNNGLSHSSAAGALLSLSSSAPTNGLNGTSTGPNGSSLNSKTSGLLTAAALAKELMASGALQPLHQNSC